MKTTILVTLFIAVGARFMADEVKAWFGWLHKKLRSMAIARLPLESRERYNEEWESGLEEVPGEIFKFIYSIGLLRAGVGIRNAALKDAVRSQMQTELPAESRSYLYMKRTLDILFAVVMISVFAVPCLLIATAILLTSKGPVFYPSQRIGRDGRTFRIWKFRSMRLNEPRHGQITGQQADGKLPQWRTQKHLQDPRITPVGRFLRTWSLDEVPQIFNVLRGEMSLIGPQPIMEVEKHFYGDNLPSYLAITPGLSGLWQVSGQSGIDYKKRAELDALYARTRSLKTDFIILLRTFAAVLKRPGRF